MRALLVALLLVARPAAAQDVAIPLSSFTLPNGLRVVVSEDHSTPIVAVNIWYHVGSAHERPGRTGFAHLFEHLMFEGSARVADGAYDELLEQAGGNTANGSTGHDRTNYFQVVPAGALDLVLWLEADRMGSLLDAMSQEKLSLQREVVKNERRQSVDNQPYGSLVDLAPPALFPGGHPYSWPTIGSMADLERATLEDVTAFFRTYYAPNNATLAIVGDVDPAAVRDAVTRYFGSIARGPAVPRLEASAAPLAASTYVTHEENVTLPEVHVAWRTPPRASKDTAALRVAAAALGGGKSSRLSKRLVFEEQTAQAVTVSTEPLLLAGNFWVTVRVKPGVDLDTAEDGIDAEIDGLAARAPSAAEMTRILNALELEIVGSLETVADKADRLNEFLYYFGEARAASGEVQELRRVTADDVTRVVRQYLQGRPRAVFSFVPAGKRHLAAERAQ